jgi:N-methylhydantoinase A
VLKRLVVGVDVGGTFTDVVTATPEGIQVQKVSSTPPNFDTAVVEGMRSLVGDLERDVADVDEVIHATTAATNAILERRGAITALVTTRGFRDVLEIGRLRVPVLYDPMWDKPKPLVTRRLRFEVDDRIDSACDIVKALADHEIDRLIERLKKTSIEAIAICLINSYVNPEHERKLAIRLARAFPGVHISASESVLPSIKEFERTSTTVVNAYVAPIMARYLESLGASLKGAGFDASVLVMQSNGGMLPASEVMSMPVFSIESGPAAGVVAALALATQLGIRDAITFDMGGTTAKASLIEDGQVSRSSEYEVGGEISINSRLIKGAGYLIGVPAIDLAEVGTGGGGVISVDSQGVPRVGPRSAGAVPGPACYGNGGDEATITDANLHLGYLPEALAGGSRGLDKLLAEKSLQERVASRLGTTITEAAYGAHLLANAGMMRAAQAVSIERGRDPRKCTLIAFGGCGPVHATGLAEQLRIDRIVVPAHPGVFSARGLLSAGLEFHGLRSIVRRSSSLQWPEVDTSFARLEASLQSRASARLASTLSFERFADLRYVGQSASLTVPLPDGVADVGSMVDVFSRAHEKEYGYRLDEEIEVESLRVIARARRDLPILVSMQQRSAGGARSRRAYFGPRFGWVDTLVVDRGQCSTAWRSGPAVVEDYDATTVVPPNWSYRIDEYDNLHLASRPQ